MLPLYRAILGSGKGRRGDLVMHRPIALTLVFRKILERVLLSDILGGSGSSMRHKAGSGRSDLHWILPWH